LLEDLGVENEIVSYAGSAFDGVVACEETEWWIGESCAFVGERIGG